MDYRRINSHMILLGMVIVVGLFAAIIVRMSMLEHGADGGTANLIFVLILGASAVLYLIIISTLSNSVSIDIATARKYCHEVRYAIGGREYFAIGFRNDAGGCELRNRNFKGSSTPKNITTLNNASDTVMVFEGFIDFLSYLSLKRNPSPTIDTAVLNSVANLRRAIPFLESHRTVHAFLDNDEAGRKTLADLRESLSGSEVVDQSAFYRNHKDLNDYWREKSAVQVRRSMSVKPMKKRGRGV